VSISRLTKISIQHDKWTLLLAAAICLNSNEMNEIMFFFIGCNWILGLKLNLVWDYKNTRKMLYWSRLNKFEEPNNYNYKSDK